MSSEKESPPVYRPITVVLSISVSLWRKDKSVRRAALSRSRRLGCRDNYLAACRAASAVLRLCTDTYQRYVSGSDDARDAPSQFVFPSSSRLRRHKMTRPRGGEVRLPRQLHRGVSRCQCCAPLWISTKSESDGY